MEIGTEREPRFLALNELQGDPRFVAVAEDCDGAVVGCAAAAAREVYVDGRPARAVYVGDLRVAPRARHSMLLARLHSFLVERVEACGVDLGYCSIVEGNRGAEALRGGRRGVPLYRPIGRIRVVAVSAPANRRTRAIVIDAARHDDIADLSRVLDAFNARHDFAPVWSEPKLERAFRDTPGLSLERMLVARERGAIVGALAAWDQSALQRRRVLAYHGAAVAYRRWHDVRALLRGRPFLPRPGELLRELHVTHVAIASDRPDVFAALLDEAWRRFAQGYHFLTFGLAEGHPLLAGLDGTEHGAFHTIVHVLARPDGKWARHVFRRPPFHEISHL